MISKADLIEATIQTAMGIPVDDSIRLNGEDGGFWGRVILHSDSEGLFAGTSYSQLAAKCKVQECLFVKQGSVVRRFSTSRDAVGIAIFHFNNQEEMEQVLNNTKSCIVKLEDPSPSFGANQDPSASLGIFVD
jgi:hypothetical protein